MQKAEREPERTLLDQLHHGVASVEMLVASGLWAVN